MWRTWCDTYYTHTPQRLSKWAVWSFRSDLLFLLAVKPYEALVSWCWWLVDSDRGIDRGTVVQRVALSPHSKKGLIPSLDRVNVTRSPRVCVDSLPVFPVPSRVHADKWQKIMNSQRPSTIYCLLRTLSIFIHCRLTSKETKMWNKIYKLCETTRIRVKYQIFRQSQTEQLTFESAEPERIVSYCLKCLFLIVTSLFCELLNVWSKSAVYM